MKTELEFQNLKLPSLPSAILLLAAAIMVSGLTAPVKGLPLLRNELGALFGTACLAGFCVWWMKQNLVPVRELFNETAQAGFSGRIKGILYLFPAYVAVFVAGIYVVPAVISFIGGLMSGAGVNAAGFEGWLTAGKALKNQRLEVLLGLAPRWQIFWMICCAPVLEELFFRRFLYVALRRRLGFVVSAGLSSALFGAIHLPVILSVATTAILGLFLAVLYEKRRDFVAVVLFHSLNNIFVLAVYWKVR